MLSEQKMLSINQLNTQIKLTQLWKADCEKYPFDITKLPSCHYGMITTGVTSDKLVIPMTTGIFIGDATRNWNLAPAKVIQWQRKK
jgi:hypothetical protein